MPQLMNKPNGMCPGPSCGGCSSPRCMAEGGAVDSWSKREDNEKGINKGASGISQAGMHVRAGNHDGVYYDKEDAYGAAKRQHGKTLGEMRSMPKPKLMAEGGEVSSDDAPEMGEDEELHHAIGGELMDALDKKDKKGIMAALNAAVMECMNGDHK